MTLGAAESPVKTKNFPAKSIKIRLPCVEYASTKERASK
jgi:hypothetical protein